MANDKQTIIDLKQELAKDKQTIFDLKQELAESNARFVLSTAVRNLLFQQFFGVLQQTDALIGNVRLFFKNVFTIILLF